MSQTNIFDSNAPNHAREDSKSRNAPDNNKDAEYDVGVGVDRCCITHHFAHLNEAVGGVVDEQYECTCVVDI